MERLLARSRKGGKVAEEPARAERWSAAAATQAAEAAQTSVMEEDQPVAERTPREKVDTDALRAARDSLREVANHSARTTLARHARKQERSTLVIRSTLAIVSFGLSSAFGTGLGGHLPRQALGALAAALIGTAVGISVIYTLIKGQAPLDGKLAKPDTPDEDAPAE